MNMNTENAVKSAIGFFVIIVGEKGSERQEIVNRFFSFFLRQEDPCPFAPVFLNGGKGFRYVP